MKRQREQRDEEKTATADACIARVSCKQNELNANIQHSSASFLKREENKKRETL